MSNTVSLEFAGDASKLDKAATQAQKSLGDVGDSATSAANDFQKSGNASEVFNDKMGKLGAGISGMSTAIDDAAGTLDAFNEIQNAAKERAQQQKRALLDVEQAQEDYNQALRDGKQASLDLDQAEVDLKQARLDQAKAIDDYNTAVKKNGKDSLEAKQATIDLAQAGVDLKQAQEDQAQAQRDANQATIDAKSAQLDLNEANSAAHPPDLAKWSQDIQMYAPLLQGLVGVMGLVTAAQWAWNAAQLASPTTWIVIAIIALVAIIVVIATKTKWFQNIWNASWGWIKKAASNVWEWLKKLPGWIGDAFSKIGRYITAPFRAAFNFIADAWNNTIGQLSWTVPDWVPGIGGASIGVPHLPHFHEGGIVPGTPGSTVIAAVQAGEEIRSVSSAGKGGPDIVISSGGSRLDDLLVEVITRAVRVRGGNVQLVLGGRNA